jgi:hypothetical protein
MKDPKMITDYDLNLLEGIFVGKMNEKDKIRLKVINRDAVDPVA